MKKQMLLLIILTLALAACSSPADAALTPAPPPTVSAAATPSPTPAPTATPTPVIMPDTDIPDIRFDTGDYASTENELSEDDKYVYYGDLLCASKENNRTTRILSIYRDWTLYNGMIYYAKYAGADSEGNISDAITEYDPQTGKTKDIYKTKGAIGDINVYKGLIYFTILNNEHYAKDIWAVKLDGSGAKRVTKNTDTFINSFCIYKDTIYYTSDESFESYGNITLYKCSIDGSGKQKLLDNAWTRFQIYNGKLSFHDINKMLDLNTGAVITVDIPDTYFSSVLWGQYILYINDTKLYAFDYNTGKTYYMTDLGDNDAELISAQSGNADIRLWGRDGTRLSRIIIKDGKASLCDITYTPSAPALQPEETLRVDYSSKLGDNRKVVVEPGNSYINGNGNEYKGLEIECKEGVNLKIEGLSIDNSGSDNACALSFFGEGNYLILGKGNDLTSGYGQPGIRVEEGTELTIEGGELKVRGGNGGAGIGGRANDAGKIKQDYRTLISSGSITINSGTIYAYSGVNAACIGGGQYGNGGGIEILGGDIYLGEETNKYISMALGCGNPDFQAGEDPELTRGVMILGGNVTIQNCYGLLGYKGVDANDILINGKANVSLLGAEKADTGLAAVMERNAYFYYNAGRGYPKPHTTTHHYAQIKLYDSNDYSHIEGGSYPLYIVNSAGERRRVLQMSDKKVISVYLPEDTYHIEYEGGTFEGKPPQKTEWFEVKKDTQVSLHLPSAKKANVYCAAIRIGYRFVFTDFPDKSGKKAPVYIVDDKGKRWEIQRVSDDNVAAAFLPKGRYYLEYNGGPLMRSDWFEVNGDTQLSLDLHPTIPDIYGIYCDGTRMRFGASEEGGRLYNTDYTVGQGHSVDLDIRHGYETQVFVNGKAWGLAEGPVEVKPGKDSIVIEAVSGDGRTKVVYTINTTSETAGTNKKITLQNPDVSQQNSCVSADRNFAFTDDYIFYTILYGRTNPAHTDLYRYDRKTGERKRIAEDVGNHIAAAEDKVFFARGGSLYCVNADGSGEELIAQAGYIWHIFAIGGKVYFGDKSRYESDNILYVYDIRDKSLKSIAMDGGFYAVRAMNGGIYIYTDEEGQPVRSYLLDERTNTLARQDEPVYMELNGYKAVSKEKGLCSIINGTGDTVAEFEDDAPEESIARYYQYIIYCPDKEKLRALNTNTGEISCLGNVSGDFMEFFEADGKLYAYFALGNLKEDDPEKYDAVLLEELSIEGGGLVTKEVIRHKTWDADPPLNAELAPEVYDYYYRAI